MGIGMFFLFFWNVPDIFSIPASLLYADVSFFFALLPFLLSAFVVDCSFWGVSAATTFSTSRLIVSLSLFSSLRFFFNSASTLLFSFSRPAIILFCSFSSSCILARSVSCSFRTAFFDSRVLFSSSFLPCSSSFFLSSSAISFFKLSASALWAFM